MKAALLLLTLLALGPAPAHAQDFEKYRVEPEGLGGDLHLLPGAGGNVTAFVGPEGVMLVDAGYGGMAAKILGALGGITDRPIRRVIDTHWHFDHVDGHDPLARDGVEIIAHENVRRRMATGGRITIIDTLVPPAPPAVLPGITFSDRLTLHLGNEEVEILHPPRAHTDGDAIVRFRRANVVCAGDVFFNCGYPFVDLSSGGSIDGMIAAVETILALSDAETRIVPGHGPVADRDRLAVYAGILREFRARIAAEIAAGRTLEEILAARPTADLDEKWGAAMFPPAMFTKMVYGSLKPE